MPQQNNINPVPPVPGEWGLEEVAGQQQEQLLAALDNEIKVKDIFDKFYNNALGKKKKKVAIQPPIVLNRAAKPYNPIEEIVGEAIFSQFKHSDFVGSKVICNPVPADADTDILVYIKDVDVFEMLEDAGGWHFCEGYGLGGNFTVFKKDKVDLIFTLDLIFYKRFMTAMQVCRLMNVLDKPTRIKIHELILKNYPEIKPKAEW